MSDRGRDWRIWATCCVEAVDSTSLDTAEIISLNSGLLLAAKRWAWAFCRNHSFSNATTVLPRVIFRLN